MDFPQFLELLKEFKTNSEEFFLCRQFVDYLIDSTGKNIKIRGLGGDNEDIFQDLGYPHRFTPKYVQGRIAKLFLLQGWYELQGDLPTTFISITVRQKRDSLGNVIMTVPVVEGYFKALSHGWHLLLREIRDMGHRPDFIGSVEPHKKNSGNPHHHTTVFDKFTIEEQIHLKHKWEKWGLGSFEHGLQFEDDVVVKSVLNYQLKHMLKSLPGYKSKFGEVPWTAHDLLFNAVAWKNHFKTWHCSKNITQVMKYDKHRGRISEIREVLGNSFTAAVEASYRVYVDSYDSKIEWIQTDLEILQDETKIIWRKRQYETKSEGVISNR
jgi:hypothetical protein